MIYYLLANFCSAFSNVLAKFFVINGIFDNYGVVMIDVLLHTNIINLFLFTILYLSAKSRNQIDFTFKETFCGKVEILQILMFAIPILAANYKVWLMGAISIPSIEISAMIKPFCVWCLAVILLREKFQVSYIKYAFFIVLGFCTANYDKIHVSHFWYMVSYVAIASFGDITRRYYCRVKKSGLQAVCAEILLFGIYAIAILLVRRKFNIYLLASPYVLIVSLITFSHHVCMIYGVRTAKTIVSLEFLNFSKIIFSIILSYIFLNDFPTLRKLIGATIIGITLVFFNIKRRGDQ